MGSAVCFNDGYLKVTDVWRSREVRLRPKIRKVLEARCRAPSTPQSDVKRAQIVLLAGEGRSTRSIAKEVGVQPRIVSKWRHRFADHGLAGLNDRPRASKKPIYNQATNRRILALLDSSRRRAMPAGRVRCWPSRCKMSTFNMFGASCASTTLIWLPGSPGARANDPDSRRKAAASSVGLSYRPAFQRDCSLCR